MKRTQRFSEQLRRAIERGDMTRYRIHKITGIPQSTLSRFVNYHSAGLSMRNIDKICKVLGLRLVSDDKPKKRKGR